MNDIFTNLYNKVLGFFKKTEATEEISAKDVACNRLRVVLMQDRTNLTPELMERMRKELVELLSKYVEMDKEALELNLEHDGDQVALMLSIPVIRAKDEDEIIEALAEADAEVDEEENDEDAEEVIESEADNEEIDEAEINDANEDLAVEEVEVIEEVKKDKK